MAKLGIMDILSFAKAGYTPKDVKELMEIDVPETKESDDVTISPEEKKAQENEAKATSKSEPSQDEQSDADDIDYKQKYEEAQEQIKQLQIANTKKDASALDLNTDPMKAVDDFLRGIM